MDFLNLHSNLSINQSEPDATRLELCKNAQHVNSFRQVLACLSQLAVDSTLVAFAVLLFCLFTIALNCYIFYFISKSAAASRTVFDQVFIAHAVVDLIVGLFVVPFYGVYNLFGYWPLGKTLCHIYVSIDYTVCHVGVLHILFIAYARLRSVQAPKNYPNERLIAHSKLVLASLWFISALVWLPLVNLTIHSTFDQPECYFALNHPFLIICQDVVAYLLPMGLIIAMTLYTMRMLSVRRRRKRENAQKNWNRLRNGAATAAATAAMVVSIHNQMTLTVGGEETAAATASEYSRLNVTEEMFSSTNEPSVSGIFKSTNGDQRTRTLSVSPQSSLGTNQSRRTRLNVFAKLYIIILTFCILWLPFCLMWPIYSICEHCIPESVYQISYWLGYTQSLINPMLLLILNPNFKCV
nr:G protein-coupled receptor [Proales similis]